MKYTIPKLFFLGELPRMANTPRAGQLYFRYSGVIAGVAIVLSSRWYKKLTIYCQLSEFYIGNWHKRG